MPTTTRSASISFAVRTSPGGIFVEGPLSGVHAVRRGDLPLLQQALLLVREERIGAAEGDRSDGGEDRFVLVVARRCGELESSPRAVGPVVSDQGFACAADSSLVRRRRNNDERTGGMMGALPAH